MMLKLLEVHLDTQQQMSKSFLAECPVFVRIHLVPIPTPHQQKNPNLKQT